MTFKKILAGVLAAASVLTVSATAFAAPEEPDKTKSVTKAGETEYETEVGMMSAELDVELPGSMKAFLNPYGAKVNVDKLATPTQMATGIVSWGYEVVNNTKDFGIFIDTKDVIGKGSTGVDIVSTAPADAKKEVWVALVFAKDTTALAAVTTPAASSKTSEAQKTAYSLVTTAKTSQIKFGYVPAATATEKGKGVIGIVGNISKQGSGTAPNTTEWTEDDSVTISYTLKISPAPAVAASTDF